MKKKTLKLILSRETLAHLSHPRLEGVAGGVPETQDKSVGCTDTCPPSFYQTGYC